MAFQSHVLFCIPQQHMMAASFFTSFPVLVIIGIFCLSLPNRYAVVSHDCINLHVFNSY